MQSETCGRVLPQLSDYIDGELPPEALAEVEAHLADCPDCRLAAQTLRKTVALYQAIPKPSLSEASRSRLQQLLQGDKTRTDTGSN